jgi:hypothetical protein
VTVLKYIPLDTPISVPAKPTRHIHSTHYYADRRNFCHCGAEFTGPAPSCPFGAVKKGLSFNLLGWTIALYKEK